MKKYPNSTKFSFVVNNSESIRYHTGDTNLTNKQYFLLGGFFIPSERKVLWDDSNYTLIVDYPTKQKIFKKKIKGPKTLLQLVNIIICKYKELDKNNKLYGHSLEDLSLNAIEINNKNEILLTVSS